jgi:serine/threonine protein kinase
VGGGKRNRRTIKRAGAPPLVFPEEIEVTKTDGNPVKLTTNKTGVDPNRSGTTGAVTEYKDPFKNSYFVKVMVIDDYNYQPIQMIQYIFHIEVGILTHLANEETTKNSPYFPKFFGSCVNTTYMDEFWAIATIKPHTEYNDLNTALDDINTKNFGDIAKQLCEGLSLLHSVGVYHRDIKLENAIINKNNEIMYIDFNGCYCQSVYTTMDAELFNGIGMQPGGIKPDGTPGYIHPGLLNEWNTHKLSSESLYKYDYWALAHTLYTLYHKNPALDELYGKKDSREREIHTYIQDMKSFLQQINPSPPDNRDILPPQDESESSSKKKGFISKTVESVKSFGNSMFNTLRSQKSGLGFTENNYKTVYAKIKELDKALSNASCWTFTQLVSANEPLTWTLTTATAADIPAATTTTTATATVPAAADIPASTTATTAATSADNVVFDELSEMAD